MNWIEAKRNCSLKVEFVKLREGIEADTQERNKDFKQFETQTGHPLFELKKGSTKMFWVHENRGHPKSAPAIDFCLETDHIYIEPKGKEGLKVGINLNKELECRYTLNGEEYTREQISRLVLEPLFFGSRLTADYS